MVYADWPQICHSVQYAYSANSACWRSCSPCIMLTCNENKSYNSEKFCVVVVGILVALVSINELNLSGPVYTWMGDCVHMSGFNSQYRTFISVCNQPPRSTQRGHRFVDRCNEYQPKVSGALRLRSKTVKPDMVGSCW